MVRFTNHDIVDILMENSRTSFVEMAKRFGVSETAVRKRVRKLEKDGIIKKYTIEVDTKKLGFGVNALIGVDTKPENYLSTLEKLKTLKQNKCMFSSTGDHMIMLQCWFRDSDELSRCMKEIDSMEGVTKTCPAIILEKVK